MRICASDAKVNRYMMLSDLEGYYCAKRYSNYRNRWNSSRTGIPPMKWNEIIGTIAGKDYYEDELIIMGARSR